MDLLDKFAYFLDEDALRSVFPDWPAEIAAVLCLDEGGGFEVLLHHTDEARSVLRRVATALDRPFGKFRVAPEVEGHPTRRVMFSEEQQFLTLLSAQPDLPALAAAYLTRHRFGGNEDDTAEPRLRKGPRKTFAAPRAARRAAADEAGLPPGYSLAAAHGAAECRFVPAEISGDQQRIRVRIEPAKVTVHTRPNRIAEVGFRDDFARFVLPRDGLRGWHPGAPAVLDIPVEHFPAALAERLADGRRMAEVTVTRRGIFVQPGPQMAALAAEAETAEPPTKRRLPYAVARLSAVLVVGAGALTGALVHVLRQPEPQLVAGLESRGPAPAPVALEEPLALLTALAQEEARGSIE